MMAQWYTDQNVDKNNQDKNASGSFFFSQLKPSHPHTRKYSDC